VSKQEQPGDPDPGYHPGGIVRGPTSDDTVLAWISPGEKYFTAEDMRRMRESSDQEWNEG
jgi:hypothetical protein